ncbi:MYXO-CTERM sorting domain-containing protein [Chondromyces apiculatus]|uniref:Tissue inhibitor of metalloproteinase n=1 Tax=Chondromyces apiculatus DSM 436 TaxID=1192034 RepID=A0A017T8U9_9BACT|nr:MYXO-CTERM sorting domain-containing protein [Chondromyces apiculatus]EYF05654.1 Hypothetical protein CAP_2944 [Chondromyces apiculatus DSM 436]
MRTLAVLLLAALLTLSLPGRAHACSCGERPPVAEALAQAVHVFTGKITALAPASNDPYAPLLATFTVTKVWKGAVTERFEVSTDATDAMCGLRFKEGQEWLLYTDRYREGVTSASLCTRSKLLGEASKEDLPQLGAGSAPVARLPLPAPAASSVTASSTASAASSSPPSASTPSGSAAKPGGCTCALTPAASPSWGIPALLATAALLLRRRQSRSRRTDHPRRALRGPLSHLDPATGRRPRRH